MKKILYLLVLFPFFCAGQTDSTDVAFKKRVLESTEVDFLTSYYKQEGSHSAVSGGMGAEKLSNTQVRINAYNNDD